MKCKIKKLGEVCDFFNGFAFKSKDTIEQSEVQLVRMGNLYQNQLDLNRKPVFYPNQFKDRYSRYLLKEGDLIVSLTGTVDKEDYGFTVEIPKHKGFLLLNQRIAKFTNFSPEISKKFLLHILRSKIFLKELYATSRGVRQANLSTTEIKKINIPVPPIEEQKRIVEILDEAFEKISIAEANTKKNLTNSIELFDSYLNKIFTQKKTGWKIKKISDISTNVEYGSSSKSLKNATANSVPVLRMGNMQSGVLNWDDLVYTDKEEEINKYVLKYNDVLFNRTNSDVHVGKTAIYKGERPGIFAGYLIRINYKKDIIDPDFLNFYLNSSIAREYGKSVMSRSINQANINGTKLKTYPIYLPSLEIQKKVVSKLYELQNETKALEKIYKLKLKALAELKQSILQKAFTGQLTTPLNKES